MRPKILLALAVAAPIALLAGLWAFIVINQTIESAPDDPADVWEWAQNNNLLTAQDVEAVLGPGTTVTDGWIGCAEGRLRELDPVGVSYHVSLTDDTWYGWGECVIPDTSQDVYATIDRSVLDGGGSTERYELALVGADIVQAFGYVTGDLGAEPSEDSGGPVVVGTEDVVIYIEGGETREQAEALAQTAVDKFTG